MAADLVPSPAVNLTLVCDVAWLFGCRLSACPLGCGCGLSLPKKWRRQIPVHDLWSTHQRHTISYTGPLYKEERIVVGPQALVIRLFNEVFTTRNLSAADDIVAEEYLEHAVEPFGQEEPGPVQGPSHAHEVVAWLRAQFPDLEMTIESIVADTDMVAVRVRSAGTNLGKLGGFAPPTNKRFAAEQSHWYRVAGGSSASTSATRDDLTAMLQMRVIHPPGPPRAG